MWDVIAHETALTNTLPQLPSVAHRQSGADGSTFRYPTRRPLWDGKSLELLRRRISEAVTKVERTSDRNRNSELPA